MKKKNPKIKLKVRKSVAKRFKITKTGKVIRRSGQIRHLSHNRSQRNRRRGRVPKIVTKTMAKKIKKMLGR
jgi:large subunit ribosomal protein L35